MNNKELAKQLFETKFIKALYNTSLNKSFINKIIVEELLKEDLIGSDGKLTDKDNAVIKNLRKKGVEEPTLKRIYEFVWKTKTNWYKFVKDLEAAFKDVSAEAVAPDTVALELIKKYEEQREKIDKEIADMVPSYAKKEKIVKKVETIKEPDEKLDAIAKVFATFNQQQTSSKEKLADFLMLSQVLGEVRGEYKRYLDLGREGYTEEEKESLYQLHARFFEIFNALELPKEVGSDRNTILQKLDDLKISEEALKQAILGIRTKFKPVIDAASRKTKGTEKQIDSEEKKERNEILDGVVKRLIAYRRRVDSWIKFIDGVESKAKEKFKDDLDKRQILVDFIEKNSQAKKEFIELKSKIESIIEEAREMKKSQQQPLSEEEHKSLFGNDIGVRAGGHEDIRKLFQSITGTTKSDKDNIDGNMEEYQEIFNNIAAKAKSPETYKISKGNIEADPNGPHANLPPIPKATKDDFLDTIVALAMYPDLKDDPKDTDLFPSLVEILEAINPQINYGKYLAKINSTLREDNRHGIKDLELEGDPSKVKKVIEEIVQQLEPYKEELILAMLEASFQDAETDASVQRSGEDLANLEGDEEFEAGMSNSSLGELVAYMNHVEKFSDLNSKNISAKSFKNFKKYKIANYIKLMFHNEGKISGIQFDILNKIQKRKINFQVLGRLVALFENRPALELDILKDFGQSLIKYSVNKSMGKSLEETLRPIIKTLIHHKEP